MYDVPRIVCRIVFVLRSSFVIVVILGVRVRLKKIIKAKITLIVTKCCAPFDFFC